MLVLKRWYTASLIEVRLELSLDRVVILIIHLIVIKRLKAFLCCWLNLRILLQTAVQRLVFLHHHFNFFHFTS